MLTILEHEIFSKVNTIMLVILNTLPAKQKGTATSNNIFAIATSLCPILQNKTLNNQTIIDLAISPLIWPPSSLNQSVLLETKLWLNRPKQQSSKIGNLKIESNKSY